MDRFVLGFGLLFPVIVYASFIETTVGTAVVNDATASYFNPAALMLVKNPQIIPQLTYANFRTRFVGKSQAIATNVTESGIATSNTHYFSPTFYAGVPLGKSLVLGLAIVSNSANRDAEDNSLLRYVQASNTIQDYDVVPAIALKINPNFSIGGSINFSYANFDLHPILGFPGSNLADAHADNQSDGRGIGANIGFLFKPNTQTVMGLDYRSRTSYALRGKSIYEGNPPIVSEDYHYTMWTPARTTFSINHFFTKKFGMVATIRRIQWDVITNMHVFGIANVRGNTPVIVNGINPYYLRNTWLVTLGTHYRVTSAWIVRVAGSYNQSPGNPRYQLTNGDSIILGASTGYDIKKNVTLDASFAHVFLLNKAISISRGRYQIQGDNQGARDSVSVKVTYNL